MMSVIIFYFQHEFNLLVYCINKIINNKNDHCKFQTYLQRSLLIYAAIAVPILLPFEYRQLIL